jgi:energy-coupling factor transport system ATP-binding protein
MIQVERLTYYYPHQEEPALKELTFTVQQGESVGIIGLNGAGKSTLCYAIMGLVPHFYHGTISGDLWVNGINVPDASLGEVSQHVGLVFQNPLHQLSGSKATVKDEIAFGLENLGMPREKMLERIEWVSELLGIASLLHRNPFSLSGGQMQRVAIASVLAMKPQVIVMDEPTSQLDPAGTAEVFAAIEALRKEGITTVIVEHKIEWLAEHCNRIAILADGELKAIDLPGKVFAQPDLHEWGVEPPVYTRVYQKIAAENHSREVPTTLKDTVERLKAYEQNDQG